MSQPKYSRSYWVKGISTSGTIRAVTIQAKGLVQELIDRHQLDKRAAQGLGEAAVGALLVATYCKKGERVNVKVEGSGHYRAAFVDTAPEGTVRGYIVTRDLENVPDDILKSQSRIGPWGEGFLSVLRTKRLEGDQPYMGTVPLLTGHLAKDLTFYWAQSEQVPSAVGVYVRFENDLLVDATGFLVQALPGATDQELRFIEGQIQAFSQVMPELDGETDPRKLLGMIFMNSGFTLLEDKDLKFFCHCDKDRVERALMLTGIAELQAILEEQGKAQVKCDFCSKEYVLEGADLQRLISELKAH